VIATRTAGAPGRRRRRGALTLVAAVWAGLAVSSRIIGAIAGGDPRRLKKALLLIPASSVLMVGLIFAIRAGMH